MKSKRTPDIRFAGFIGDWELSRLGKISEKVTEKNKNNIYSETLTNSAEFGIINQRDYFDKDISNEKNLDGYYVVRPDDFVYNPRISNLAPVGPIKRNKLGRTGVMSPLYYVFRTHDVDKTYLEKYFSSDSWHTFMKLNGDSGARSDRFAIKDTIFREMPIPTPSIEEQSKIGNLFEQLDNNIALHQQELTTLKQTQQGFLQKMFPKEGESMPEVRFPEFIEDWEQSELSDEVEVIGTGKSKFKSNTKKSDKTPYAVLGSTDIIGYDSHFDYSGEFILTARVGANAGTLYTHSGDVKISDNTVFIQSNNLNFIYYLLTQFDLKKLSFGSGQPLVKASELKKLKLMFPKSKEEQTKIGNFFKLLDYTIDLHHRELDALKETKKAFAQKMFV